MANIWIEEKLSHIFDIYLAEVHEDISRKIEHFDSITNSLFVLTQSLFGNNQKVKYHQRELEGKFFRFGLANQSIINLIRGNDFRLINQQTTIADIFSINSVTRIQIESFLIIYYLIFGEVSDSEKNFRYDIYKLHGLQKQISFKTSADFPQKQKNIDKIEIEINEAITNIKNSSLYKTASEKKKQEYLKPKFAKLIKSETLFEKSGIDNIRAQQMWQIYSNYAHSEHISDRQYNTLYKTEKSLTSSLSLILAVNSFMTSRLILNFKKLFDCVERKYSELNSSSRSNIEFWSIVKTK